MLQQRPAKIVPGEPHATSESGGGGGRRSLAAATEALPRDTPTPPQCSSRGMGGGGLLLSICILPRSL